jgi:uncharacterized membrane protein YgcG
MHGCALVDSLLTGMVGRGEFLARLRKAVALVVEKAKQRAEELKKQGKKVNASRVPHIDIEKFKRVKAHRDNLAHGPIIPSVDEARQSLVVLARCYFELRELWNAETSIWLGTIHGKTQPETASSRSNSRQATVASDLDLVVTFANEGTELERGAALVIAFSLFDALLLDINGSVRPEKAYKFEDWDWLATGFEPDLAGDRTPTFRYVKPFLHLQFAVTHGWITKARYDNGLPDVIKARNSFAHDGALPKTATHVAALASVIPSLVDRVALERRTRQTETELAVLDKAPSPAQIKAAADSPHPKVRARSIQAAISSLDWALNVLAEPDADYVRDAPLKHKLGFVTTGRTMTGWTLVSTDVFQSLDVHDAIGKGMDPPDASETVRLVDAVLKTAELVTAHKKDVEYQAALLTVMRSPSELLAASRSPEPRLRVASLLAAASCLNDELGGLLVDYHPDDSPPLLRDSLAEAVNRKLIAVRDPSSLETALCALDVAQLGTPPPLDDLTFAGVQVILAIANTAKALASYGRSRRLVQESYLAALRNVQAEDSEAATNDQKKVMNWMWIGARWSMLMAALIGTGTYFQGCNDGLNKYDIKLGIKLGIGMAFTWGGKALLVTLCLIGPVVGCLWLRAYGIRWVGKNLRTSTVRRAFLNDVAKHRRELAEYAETFDPSEASAVAASASEIDRAADQSLIDNPLARPNPRRVRGKPRSSHSRRTTVGIIYGTCITGILAAAISRSDGCSSGSGSSSSSSGSGSSSSGSNSAEGLLSPWTDASTGTCPSIRDGSCRDDLLVQTGSTGKVRPVGDDCPELRELLHGKSEFRGTRLVLATRGRDWLCGAIVQNQCQANALRALVAKRFKIKTNPSIRCEHVKVEHEFETID